MKTIKQIADELGVSKQAVHYRLRKIGASKENGLLTSNETGLLTLSLTAETLVKKEFQGKERQTFDVKEASNNSQKETAFIQSLKSENEFLREQLRTKDEQLERLDKRLAEAQMLHADTKKLLPKRKLRALEAAATEAPPMGGVGKNFFARIFGVKNSTV